MHIKNSNQTSDKALQWHPAFYAGIQIEFAEEADNLTFENEHHLGTKPKVLDVLIIKKNSLRSLLPSKRNERSHIPSRLWRDGTALACVTCSLRTNQRSDWCSSKQYLKFSHTYSKNIGRIFRTHNIIDYKSPDDSLSIDDFYLVYAYACMYKSDTKYVDEISAEEITISLVSAKYPRKLIKHLTSVRKYTVKFIENGIYYIKGDFFPIQIIISSKLSKEENFWLHNLRNNITNKEEALNILDQYQKHHQEKLYTSMMNIIVNANHTIFQEVIHMCEALEKIFAKQLQEEIKQITAEKDALLAEKDAYIKKLEAMLAMQTNASAQS